jgi:hypothetical protein
MKKVKRVNMDNVLSLQVWIWDIQTYWSHHHKKETGRKNNGEDELTWGLIHVYMEIHNKNPCITVIK